MTERLVVDQDDTEPLDRPATTPTGVARVNLLPAEIARERRQQRIAGISMGVLALYLCVLGVLYALARGDVADARAVRDQTAADVAARRAELDTLAEYQTLTERIDARERLLTAAMHDELSWARVFGELALSFSADASLTQAQAATAESQEGATAPQPDATGEEEAEDAPVGQVTFTGYSVQRVAPGVEEVLLQMEDSDGLVDSYVVTTGEEERGGEQVTGFEARVDLNTEVRTGRYDDGLPQESIE